MGTNACSDLGNETTHGLRDLRRMETENEPERPNEAPEETNRKPHDLFPVSKTSHTVHNNYWTENLLLLNLVYLRWRLWVSWLIMWLKSVVDRATLLTGKNTDIGQLHVSFIFASSSDFRHHVLKVGSFQTRECCTCNTKWHMFQ